MKVELHSHTHFSRDCLLPYDRIIAECQRKNIGALAVTDHNEIDGAFAMRDRAPFPVIVSEEIFTDSGEIIGLFLKEFIPRGLPIRETAERIKAQGALVYVPHAFDSHRKGAIGSAGLSKIEDLIDVIEVLNARNLTAADDEKACVYAGEHKFAKAAGSDAHSLREFGAANVEMAPFDGPVDFLDKLRHGAIIGGRSPSFVHFSSTYAKLYKRAAHRLKCS